jgi:cell division control protein 6
MILDRRALDPDIQPETLVRRDQELNALASAVNPSDVHYRVTFLFGPSGAGKTTVAKFALEQAERELFDVRTGYLPCAREKRAGVLRGLVRDVIGNHAVYPSRGAAELLEELRSVDDHLLLVLDELDQLAEKEVLEDLYNLPNSILICIANREEELFSELQQHERLYSRLSGHETITFDRYSHADLVAILERRVDRGLQDGAITDESIEAIANAANGDARRAIAILGASARAATDAGVNVITPDIVDANITEAVSNLRDRRLEELSGGILEVYEVIEAADGAIAPGCIYERYCERVDDPVTRRTMSTYLGKLEDYDLVESSGQTVRKRYEVAAPAVSH